MTVILQRALPPEMSGAPGLPGVGPCDADDWLRVDDAYTGQMARKAELLGAQRDDVLWLDPAAIPAAQELLQQVLSLLPTKGFSVDGDDVTCPDGRQVTINHADPLGTLSQLVQEDLCILQKRGDEHVLTGAILCFPASWRLAEKAGRPLIGIHDPVPEYDDTLARRVQRLFDGVKTGRPLWRFNKLWYDDPELFQPRSAREPRRVGPAQDAAPYIRSERQCILRLPETDAVVFTIHTFVIAS